MSMHKIPLTEIEKMGLEKHGLDIGTPSQLSDVFRQGIQWALSQKYFGNEIFEAGRRQAELEKLPVSPDFETFAKFYRMDLLRIGNTYSDNDTNYANWIWDKARQALMQTAKRSSWVQRLCDDYERQGKLNGFTPDTALAMVRQEMPLYTTPPTAASLVAEMVNRFLGWKLPKDFAPDAGISFSPEFNVEYMASLGKPPMRHEPIGTNLFNADQAKAMFEHCIPSVETPKGEVGWVLEKDGTSQLLYAYCAENLMLGWTTDNLRAIRFARKADAEQLALIMEDADRVAEHMWVL